jgi:hypothetical protein
VKNNALKQDNTILNDMREAIVFLVISLSRNLININELDSVERNTGGTFFGLTPSSDNHSATHGH